MDTEEEGIPSIVNVICKGRRYESWVNIKNIQNIVQRGEREMHPEKSGTGFSLDKEIVEGSSSETWSHFCFVKLPLTKTIERWIETLLLIFALIYESSKAFVYVTYILYMYIQFPRPLLWDCVWGVRCIHSHKCLMSICCGSSVLDSAVAVGLWQWTWQRRFRSPFLLCAHGRETDLTCKCLNKEDNFWKWQVQETKLNSV